MKEEKMYYEGLEKKMLAIFFVLLFIPLVIFVAISLHYTNEMGESIVKDSRETGAIAVCDARLIGSLSINESKDALMNQTEFYLQRLAIHKASENDLFFESIRKDTESLAQYARGVFSGMDCRASKCHASVAPVRIKVLKENKSIGQNYIKSTKESLDNAKSMAPVLKLILDNSLYASRTYLALNDGVFILYPAYADLPLFSEGQNSTSNDLGESYDPRVQKWYISAVESKGTICTALHISAISKDYVITCATPVYVNGKLIGVVGLDINYDILSEYILSINSGKSGYIFIIDKEGNIVARSDIQQGDPIRFDNLLQTNNVSLKNIVKNMVSGNIGYGKTMFEGEEKYIAYAPINATKWSIGVVVPVSEIIKPTISTEKRIKKVTNETGYKIKLSTKQMSTKIDKTTNKMQYMFSIIAIISLWIIGLSAFYFGRKIKYYGMHLKDTKDYLDYLIENAKDIIYTVDLKGNFNLLNKKAEEITGYRREELIGKHFTEVLAPEY
ncbi:MAG: cache domain-containing protein, partial [Methanosarcinales archaeon]